MKRRLLASLVVALIAICTISAAPVEFVFGGLDQHAEVLGGFLPSFLKAGAGYNGFSLIDGNTTQINQIVGGGYSQRKVWQTPVTGSVQDHDPIVYDTIRAEWEVGLSQGLLQSTVPGKDLLTLSVGYIGRYERNIDSFREGKVRNNNGEYVIDSLDNRIGKDYEGAIYPDLRGDRQHLGTLFSFDVMLDMMDDQGMYSNGLLANASVEWAPLALNSALDGVADYYSLTFNAVGAYTPYSFVEDGQHWFSLTFVDRFNVNWTDGEEVPVYAQGPVSLGRKVRGYNTWTYNTQFTVVNNLDLRLAGPDWHSILGYQIAYLFDGYKFSEGPDTSVTGSFTFFLDF